MIEIISTLPIEHYKGYVIIRIECRSGAFDYSTRYCFCKDGDVNKRSQWDAGWYYSREGAKEVIDSIIDKGTVSLTTSERKRWVLDPCEKAGYGWDYQSLKKIVKNYNKANGRRKVGYIEMFHNANYHSFADALENGDKKALEEQLEGANHYREKFEVMLHIKDKNFTDEQGKEMEKVIEDAVYEALSKRGVKFHRLKVSALFINDW